MEKRRLWIIGAGGFGREVLAWLDHVPAADRDWEPAGFIDLTTDSFSGASCRLQVFCEDPPDLSTEDRFICTIGSPKRRRSVVAEYEKRGLEFITLIHPTAVVGSDCKIGAGSILCPHSVLTTNVTLGKHVVLNVSASVGHDSVLGDYCTLSAHCDVTGQCELGCGVFMGTHAQLLPTIKAGDFSTVGAGSTVTHDVRPNTTVFGVPATRL